MTPVGRVLPTLLVALAVAGSAGRAAGATSVNADVNGDGRVVLACLGDSNTYADWQFKQHEGFPKGRGWCEQLAEYLGPTVVLWNLATPGATAVRNQWPDLPPDVLFSGFSQIEQALALDRPDIVLVAFGTNDVLPDHAADPATILAAHCEIAARARAAGALVLVATAPKPQPTHDREYRRSPETLARFNELLRASFTPDAVLDFEALLEPEDYFDDLHMNAAGQYKRAQEAKRKIEAALSPAALLPEPPPLGQAFAADACPACRLPAGQRALTATAAVDDDGSRRAHATAAR